MKISNWIVGEGAEDAINSTRDAYGSQIDGLNIASSGKKMTDFVSLKSYNTMSGAKSNNPIKSKGRMPNMFATKKIKDKQEKKMAEKDATFLFNEGIKSC